MRYPDGIDKKQSQYINYRNRGITLEEEINKTNEYYQSINLAIVHKKPTPIQVTKVDYSTGNTIIKEAYFKTPSTTDYNGIYRGKYIDFEAKETENKTMFPVSNIHYHQIEHIRKIINHGGIAFLIIRFKKLNKCFLLKGEDFITLIDNKKRSIPISFFTEYGHEIKENYNPRLEYLKIIDYVYFGGDFNEICSEKNN